MNLLTLTSAAHAAQPVVQDMTWHELLLMGLAVGGALIGLGMILVGVAVLAPKGARPVPPASTPASSNRKASRRPGSHGSSHGGAL